MEIFMDHQRKNNMTREATIVLMRGVFSNCKTFDEFLQFSLSN